MKKSKKKKVRRTSASSATEKRKEVSLQSYHLMFNLLSLPNSLLLSIMLLDYSELSIMSRYCLLSRCEAQKDSRRKLAEEAARRWQERDDKLEASIRVVEQRGAKAAAEREAQRKAQKERLQRVARRKGSEASTHAVIYHLYNIEYVIYNI